MNQSILNELTRIFSQIPYNRMLGLNVEAIDLDKSVMSFSMKNDLVGNVAHGILHGGVTSSVIDMAGGIAAIASAIRKQQEKNIDELKAALSKISTTNLYINFLNPGKGNQFTVTSRILRSGNKICFTHTELHNEENTLIATGDGTYLIG